MSLRDKITLLVCSCDNYSDLWYPFFSLLEKYWPHLDCRIILNTETKHFSHNGFNIETYSFGETMYGRRMLNHLEMIKTPFTLLLLDDFFIRRPVNDYIIMRLIEKMEKEVRIAAMYFYVNPFCDNTYDDYYGFVKMPRYAPFKLNMQAGIWRTESLKKYWAPNDNPWIWEVFVNYLTFDSSDLFYSLNNTNCAPIYYGFNRSGMGVFRGKWVIEDVKPLFDAHNITIDYSKRGIYNPIKAVDRLPIFKTLPYVFKRIPFRHAIGFSAFEIWKRMLRIVKLQPKYRNYTEFLSFNYN